MALSAGVTERLTGIVGAAAVLTKVEDLVPYSFDGTAALTQRPDAVVFPRTTDEVARCVEVAAASNVPIVTRGSGTGLSGGSVPSPGSLVLCLTQMNAILDVDPRNLTLRAQAGAVTQSIDEAAGRQPRNTVPVYVRRYGIRAMAMLAGRLPEDGGFEIIALGPAPPASQKATEALLMEGLDVLVLPLAGGVTAEWLEHQVAGWFEERRQEKRKAKKGPPAVRPKTSRSIH